LLTSSSLPLIVTSSAFAWPSAPTTDEEEEDEEADEEEDEEEDAKHKQHQELFRVNMTTKRKTSYLADVPSKSNSRTAWPTGTPLQLDQLETIRDILPGHCIQQLAQGCAGLLC
jgi:hypothetical protein